MIFEKIYFEHGGSYVKNYIFKVISGMFLFINGSIICGRSSCLTFEIFPLTIVKFIDSDINYIFQHSFAYFYLIQTEKESDMEFLRCRFGSERISNENWNNHFQFYGKVSITDCHFLEDNFNNNGLSFHFNKVFILNHY